MALKLQTVKARIGRTFADGTRPRAPSGPQLARPRSGPSPWLVLGTAFAVGYVAARVIDWRGHAHPRW